MELPYLFQALVDGKYGILHPWILPREPWLHVLWRPGEAYYDRNVSKDQGQRQAIRRKKRESK